jgi:hypothetical protein
MRAAVSWRLRPDEIMKKYDAVLMLSGGKDSCSLAIDLKDQQNILCVTIDNGFLSDVAKNNIYKLKSLAGIDSLIYKPDIADYRKLVESNKSLFETCSECSAKTFRYAIDICKLLKIGILYTGFTKYTAQAQKWPVIAEHYVFDDITIISPYMKRYDFPYIKVNLTQYGIVYDPTVTNCIHIKELIARDTDNCFEKEISLMYKAGQIDDNERKSYTDFIESCRAVSVRRWLCAKGIK